LDLLVEVFEDPHHTRGLGGGAVGGDGHEVELDGDVDLAGQVGHHHERSLEDADDEEFLPPIVVGDLPPHPLECGCDLLGCDQAPYVCHVRRFRLFTTRSRRVAWSTQPPGSLRSLGSHPGRRSETTAGWAGRREATTPASASDRITAGWREAGSTVMSPTVSASATIHAAPSGIATGGRS